MFSPVVIVVCSGFLLYFVLDNLAAGNKANQFVEP
jgi:hypothetical protein